MIQGIIFDYNGVLTKGDWYWTLVRERAHNFEQQEEEFARWADEVDLGKVTVDRFLSGVAERLDMSADDVIAYKNKFHAESLRQDILDLVRALKKEYVTALMSNHSATTLRPVVQEYNLDELFNYICISSEVGLVKPDTRMFQNVVDRLHLTFEEVVFIDDLQRHVDAAKELGIDAFVFTTFDQLQKDLHERGINTL